MLPKRKGSGFGANFSKPSRARQWIRRSALAVNTSGANILHPGTGIWVSTAEDEVRFLTGLPDASHGTHGILAEPARFSRTIYSADFSQAVWTTSDVTKTTTSLPSVIEGKTAAELTTSVAGGYCQQTFAAQPSNPLTIHAVVEQDTATEVHLAILKFDGTVVNLLRVAFNFETGSFARVSGSITTNYALRAVKTHTTGPNNNPVWILLASLTAGGDVVNADRVRIFPSGTTGTNSTIVHNVSVDTAAALSPLVSGASTGERSEDIILVNLPREILPETTGVTVFSRYRHYHDHNLAETSVVGGVASVSGLESVGLQISGAVESAIIKRNGVYAYETCSSPEAENETRTRIVAYKDNTIVALSGGAVTTSTKPDADMEAVSVVTVAFAVGPEILEAVYVVPTNLPASSLLAYVS